MRKAKPLWVVFDRDGNPRNAVAGGLRDNPLPEDMGCAERSHGWYAIRYAPAPKRKRKKGVAK